MSDCPTCGSYVCDVCNSSVDGEFVFDFDGRDYCLECQERLGVYERWWWQVWKEGGWKYDV